MKKRILVLALAALMLFMLVACSSETPTTTAAAEGAEPTETATETETDETVSDVTIEGEAYKIGFATWGIADTYAKRMVDMVQSSCDATGTELLYMDWIDYDGDSILQTYQSLIEQGCDGLITVVITAPMIELCEKNNVPIVLSHGIIEDADTLKMAEESSTYVGNMMNDDYDSGYVMAQALKDNGCMNVLYAGPPQGYSTQTDKRFEGAMAYINDNADMTLLAEDRSNEANTVIQMLTAYPEADGLILSEASMMEAFQAAGLLGDIKIVTSNGQGFVGEYLENGTFICVPGTEASADGAAISFAMLYNKLSGHDIIENKIESILVPFVYLHNYEDYEAYAQAFLGDNMTFTPDEIRYMTVVYNPELTPQEFITFAEGTTLEGVIERHS